MEQSELDLSQVVDPFSLAKKTEEQYPEWARHRDEIAILRRQIADLEDEAAKKIDPLKAKIKSYEGLLLACCPHPEKFVERRSHNIPGGYLNQSEHTKWVQCTICGAESEKKTTYGGFN